jgi:hypothetical protein
MTSYYFRGAVVYGLILAAFLWPLIRNRRLRVRELTAHLLLGSVAIVAQLMPGTNALYPMIHWGMYGSATPPRVLLVLEVVNSDGAAAAYPFNCVAFWSPGPLRDRSTFNPITAKVAKLQAECGCDTGDPALDSLLGNLLAIGNRCLEIPAREIRLSQYDIVIHRSTTQPRAQVLYKRHGV